MSEKYFFISLQNIKIDQIVTIHGDEFHHMVHVSRLKRGDIVGLLDGKGKTYRAVIELVDRNFAELKIVDVEKKKSQVFDLAVAVISPQRLDWAVEKCTEIGLDKFIPFTSERCIWRGDEEKRKKKRERLIRKAISACKQSGQSWLPDIKEIVDFESLVKEVEGYEIVLLASLSGRDMRSVKEELGTKPWDGKVLGIVGPEGGFSEYEEQVLTMSGAIPVNLGQSRLRTETACMLLTFLVNYELLT